MKVIVTNSYDETCAVIADMIKELVNAQARCQARPCHGRYAGAHLQKAHRDE